MQQRCDSADRAQRFTNDLINQVVLYIDDKSVSVHPVHVRDLDLKSSARWHHPSSGCDLPHLGLYRRRESIRSVDRGTARVVVANDRGQFGGDLRVTAKASAAFMVECMVRLKDAMRVEPAQHRHEMLIV